MRTTGAPAGGDGRRFLVIDGEMMLAGARPGSRKADREARLCPVVIALELDDEFMAAYAAAIRADEGIRTPES